MLPLNVRSLSATTLEAFFFLDPSPAAHSTKRRNRLQLAYRTSNHVMKSRSCLDLSVQDPLFNFDLEPPFAKAVSQVSQSSCFGCSACGFCPRPCECKRSLWKYDHLRQSWDPVLLGIRPAAPLPTKTKAGSASLVVKACTLCCGQPVAGIQVDLGEDQRVQSVTDRQGSCALRDDTCQPELRVLATHSAFVNGYCEFSVSAEPKTHGELPMFLEPPVRVFTVPGPRDQLALQLLVGDGDSVLIPVDAEPFSGTICDGRGEALLRLGADPGRIPLTHLKAFPEAGECPIICLAHAQVQLEGYEWCPAGPRLGCKLRTQRH